LNRHFGGFRGLPVKWAESTPKVAILIGGSEVEISDSEVKDRFLMMRVVGLN
jgi:hypothetical protein